MPPALCADCWREYPRSAPGICTDCGHNIRGDNPTVLDPRLRARRENERRYAFTRLAEDDPMIADPPKPQC